MNRTKFSLDIAAYALFIVVILALPQFYDEFWLNRFAKYLIYGMLAIAISLSWGYAGVLNLGQGLFFGAAGYVVGLLGRIRRPLHVTQASSFTSSRESLTGHGAERVESSGHCFTWAQPVGS